MNSKENKTNNQNISQCNNNINNNNNHVLKNQTKLIVEKMKKREFPFNDELINDYFNQFLERTKKE